MGCVDWNKVQRSFRKWFGDPPVPFLTPLIDKEIESAKTHFREVLCDDTLKASFDPVSVTDEQMQKALDWQKNHAKIRYRTDFKLLTEMPRRNGVLYNITGDGTKPDKPFGISQECSDFFPAAMREGYEINNLPFGPQLTLEEMERIYKTCVHYLEVRNGDKLFGWRLAEVKRKFITACGFQVTLQKLGEGLFTFNA